MKKCQVLFAFLFVFIPQRGKESIKKDEQLNGKWSVVSEKSKIDFKITVMYLFPVSGSFSKVNGTIDIRHDLLEADAVLVIDPASIDTGNEKRDTHLRSEDFFYVNQFPDIRFVSTQIEQADPGRSYTVTGDLTIKDVTRSINVPVILEGINDQGEIVFTGSKIINRRDYNINYSGRGLSDTAELEITIVGKKDKE